MYHFCVKKSLLLLHHPHRLVDCGKDVRRVFDLLPEGELVGGGDGVEVEVGHGGERPVKAQHAVGGGGLIAAVVLQELLGKICSCSQDQVAVTVLDILLVLPSSILSGPFSNFRTNRAGEKKSKNILLSRERLSSISDNFDPFRLKYKHTNELC